MNFQSSLFLFLFLFFTEFWNSLEVASRTLFLRVEFTLYSAVLTMPGCFSLPSPHTRPPKPLCIVHSLRSEEGVVRAGRGPNLMFLFLHCALFSSFPSFRESIVSILFLESCWCVLSPLYQQSAHISRSSDCPLESASRILCLLLPLCLYGPDFTSVYHHLLPQVP